MQTKRQHIYEKKLTHTCTNKKNKKSTATTLSLQPSTQMGEVCITILFSSFFLFNYHQCIILGFDFFFFFCFLNRKRKNKRKTKWKRKKLMKKKRKKKRKNQRNKKDDKESKEESASPEIMQGTTFAMHGYFKHDFWHLLSQGLFCNTQAKDRDYFEFFIKLGTNMQQGYKIRD